MINLLTDLLDIATIESGRIDLKYQEVNLSDLIEERFNLHQHTAKEKNIKINAQIEPSLSSQIDPERFVQVIDNLITNAIKYSPLDSSVDITLEKKDTQWALTISDNGPGIKPDEVSKLFGAFEKLSSKTTAGETSNGLGLAIVKRIVEAHDGEAHYENNEPCGSKFSVVIPFVNNAI
jgi:signal transduction histidine kinase